MGYSDTFSERFIRAVIAPLWAKKEGTDYLEHLSQLEKGQYEERDVIKRGQEIKLQALVSHAYANVPFYRKRFNESGVKPEDIRSLEDLQLLPLLTKDDVRQNLPEMLATNYPINQLVRLKTSGSTGISLEFYADKRSLEFKRACAIRHNRWAGWDIGTMCAAVWGNPEYKKNWRLWLRNLLLDRSIFLDTVGMTKSDMLAFYKKSNSLKEYVVFGHAHSIYLYALFLKESGLSPTRPRGIVSTAMVLHPFERVMIEAVFDQKVYNRYGSEEMGLIASECEAHSGLHINTDGIVLQIVRDGKYLSDGESGSIIITDLTNYGMPFLRYRIGDTGSVNNGICTCGRTLPLLNELEGREADYVVTPNSKFISGISLTENFALKIPGVIQMQIIQDKRDHLLLKVVSNDIFESEGVPILGKMATDLFGVGMRIDIEKVSSIPQNANGKYRFVISNVAADNLS